MHVHKLDVHVSKLQYLMYLLLLCNLVALSPSKLLKLHLLSTGYPMLLIK